MDTTTQLWFTAVLVAMFVFIHWLKKKGPSNISARTDELKRLEDRVNYTKQYMVVVDELTALLKQGSEELKKGINSPETGGKLKDVSIRLLAMDSKLKELNPNHQESQLVSIAFHLIEIYSMSEVGKKPN